MTALEGSGMSPPGSSTSSGTREGNTSWRLERWAGDWNRGAAFKACTYLVWPQATNDKHPLKLICFIFPILGKNLMMGFLKLQ